MGELLTFLFFGALAGFLFEVGYSIKRIVRFNMWIGYFCDFACGISACIIFFLTSLFCVFGIFRFAFLISFLVGFLIERLSVGKLVASIFDLVYNMFVKIFGKFKRTKISKKILK